MNKVKNKKPFAAKDILYLVFQFAALAMLFYFVMATPEVCHASVESSLDNMRSKLTNVILPVLSVCGLIVAAISFFSGNERAKQHVFYAILGAAIGFGAQSIVNFIAQTVN